MSVDELGVPPGQEGRFGCRIVLPVDLAPPGQEGECLSMGLVSLLIRRAGVPPGAKQ